MVNKIGARTLVAAAFWSMSLFFYASAIAPLLLVPKPISKGMGVASAILIAIGTIISRTKMASNIVNSADQSIGRRKSYVLRALSWMAFFMMPIIFVGYALMKKDPSYVSSSNYMLVPFGFLFFYMGRWCVFMAGSRYKKTHRKGRR